MTCSLALLCLDSSKASEPPADCLQVCRSYNTAALQLALDLVDWLAPIDPQSTPFRSQYPVLVPRNTGVLMGTQHFLMGVGLLASRMDPVKINLTFQILITSLNYFSEKIFVLNQ